MVENLSNRIMIYSDSTCQWTQKEITVKSRLLLNTESAFAYLVSLKP